MSAVVWKYPIPSRDDIEIDMPVGAKILHVDVQQGIPSLWALVDTHADVETRRFRLAGTGHTLDNEEEIEHVGTILHPEHRLVFHLFERLS